MPLLISGAIGIRGFVVARRKGAICKKTWDETVGKLTPKTWTLFSDDDIHYRIFKDEQGPVTWKQTSHGELFAIAQAAKQKSFTYIAYGWYLL